MLLTYINLSYLLVGVVCGVIISFAMRPKSKAAEKNHQDFLKYVQSINYVIDNETDRAINELTNLVKLNPELIEIYLAIGNLFRIRGELNRALIVHKSLMAKPHIDDKLKREIILAIGTDYDKAGFHQKAADNFKRLVDMDGSDEDAVHLLKESLEKNHEWEEALNVLKNFGLKRKNEEAHILVAIGMEKKVNGDNQSAKSFFKKAIKTDNDCFEAYYELARLEYNEDNKEKSLMLIKKAIEKNHRFVSVVSGFVTEVLKEDYLEFYESILSKFPKSPELIFDLLHHLSSENRLLLAEDLIGSASFEEEEYKRLLYYWKCKIDIIKKNIDSRPVWQFLDNISEKPKFRCKYCGFVQKEVFWKCPQCRKWDTSKVIFN